MNKKINDVILLKIRLDNIFIDKDVDGWMNEQDWLQAEAW